MVEEKTWRIGEVAEALNLKTHVLRFWETEFPQLDPIRAESGQRLYRESDILVLKRIQQLLHEQGMTIDGARRILDGASGSEETASDESPAEDFLALVENELVNICNLLARESVK